jgi:hypothetical protein
MLRANTNVCSWKMWPDRGESSGRLQLALPSRVLHRTGVTHMMLYSRHMAAVRNLSIRRKCKIASTSAPRCSCLMYRFHLVRQVRTLDDSSLDRMCPERSGCCSVSLQFFCSLEPGGCILGLSTNGLEPWVPNYLSPALFAVRHCPCLMPQTSGRSQG